MSSSSIPFASSSKRPISSQRDNHVLDNNYTTHPRRYHKNSTRIFRNKSNNSRHRVSSTHTNYRSASTSVPSADVSSLVPPIISTTSFSTTSPNCFSTIHPTRISAIQPATPPSAPTIHTTSSPTSFSIIHPTRISAVYPTSPPTSVPIIHPTPPSTTFATSPPRIPLTTTPSSISSVPLIISSTAPSKTFSISTPKPPSNSRYNHHLKSRLHTEDYQSKRHQPHRVQTKVTSKPSSISEKSYADHWNDIMTETTTVITTTTTTVISDHIVTDQHVPSTTTTTSSSTSSINPLCKNYIKNICKNGDHCTHYHPLVITDQMIKMVSRIINTCYCGSPQRKTTPNDGQHGHETHIICDRTGKSMHKCL